MIQAPLGPVADRQLSLPRKGPGKQVRQSDAAPQPGRAGLLRARRVGPELVGSSHLHRSWRPVRGHGPGCWRRRTACMPTAMPGTDIRARTRRREGARIPCRPNAAVPLRAILMARTDGQLDVVSAETGLAMLIEACERAVEGLDPDVPPAQMRALLTIDHAGSLNLSRLAGALGTTPSAASRLCDRMQAAGLGTRDRAAARP